MIAKKLSLIFALLPLGFLSAQESPNPMAAEAQLLVARISRENDFRGAVLVASGGKILIKTSTGNAIENGQIPNTTDTKFEIASLTKQFTAAAILKLAEEGKLTLSDPIAKWYAESPSTWEGITIHHLLTHTSGLPGNTPQDFKRGINTRYTSSELIETFRDRELLFRPGTQWRYSNSGYYVLAYIVERASGLSFSDYLSRSIFQPLNMADSGQVSSTTLVANKAQGYSKERDSFRLADAYDRSLELGAGGIYSTVDDLLKWNTALSRNTILSRASTDLMFKAYPPGTYGYGWFVEKGTRTKVFHEGSDPGFSAFELRYPDEDSIVIVLSNYEGAPVRSLAESLGALLAGSR